MCQLGVVNLLVNLDLGLTLTNRKYVRLALCTQALLHLKLIYASLIKILGT